MLRLVLKNRPPVGHRVGHRVGHGLGHRVGHGQGHVLSTPQVGPVLANEEKSDQTEKGINVVH